MTSLIHALKSFQNGVCSKEELFDEVDQILKSERANEAWLLKTLNEENTKVPLPEDVHGEVQGKIKKAAEVKNHPLDGDPAEVGGLPGVDQDESRTRLATSLFPNSSSSNGAGDALAWPAAADLVSGAPHSVESEHLKGTGDVLNDRFVLEECIGTGGMSTVYKALDRRKLEADDRNPYVAVKVLNLEFRAHPDSLIALQREAKKSQSLAHPNIVRVYDFDRDGPTVYMTMEYLTGQSLAKVLRAPGFKGLTENDAMRILEGIARALVFAHENGIIHADFKPANVILTDDGKVKVIDFGIARAFQRPDDSDMEVTRFDAGTLGALTPTYASPEMLEHQEPDPRDDVYALACITYEMLTGRHPFGRMQATEARDGGLEVERRTQLSRRQWKTLKSALEFDREKRTPDIGKFLADIKPEQAVVVPTPLYAAGKVALVAAAGFLAYFYLIADVVEQNSTERYVAMAPDDGNPDKSIEIASLNGPLSGKSGEAVLTVSGPEPREEGKGSGIEKLAKVTEPEPVKPKISEVQNLSMASVAGILDELPCAALNPSVKDGKVNLQGYVSRKLNVKQLEKDLLALPGARDVNLKLVKVDNNKCAVIEMLAPYWVPGQGAERNALIQTGKKDNLFTEGDPLVVKLTTPDYASYVNIDYYSLDGGVVHMVPGPRARDNQAPANYTATIGDLGEWTIAEPFGTEMVTVVLTPQPLFEKQRDEYETDSDYLAAVRAQLDRITKKLGKDKVAVDFVMIDTKPKSLLQGLRDSVPGSP